MQCERYNALLSAYADGMLKGRQEAAVARHLCECRRCRDDLAEIRVLRALLHSLPDPRPRDAFWSDAHRSFRQRRAARARMFLKVSFPRHGWALAAAAGALLLLAATPRQLDRATVHADSLAVSPDALVALHASAAAGCPGADAAALHFSATESRAADWAHDHQLDAD